MKLHQARGFSLIDLLVTVAILGVLASFAWPSYQRYVIKTKRTEAQVLLVEIQGQMERFRFDHQSYPSTLSDIAVYGQDEVPTMNENYLVVISAESSACQIDSCYVLEAKPQGNQVKDGALELHSNGTRLGNW